MHHSRPICVLLAFAAFSHTVCGDVLFPSSLSSSPPSSLNDYNGIRNTTVEFPDVGDNNDVTNVTTTTTTTTTSATTTNTGFPTTLAPTPTVKGGPWHFNYSSSNHFCILLEASSIDLQITYPTLIGNHSVVSLKGPGNHTVPVAPLSVCGANLSNVELNETLVLNMDVVVASQHNVSIPPYTVIIRFHFTRDPVVTGDKSLDKSQMYKIEVDYQYRPDIFVGIDPTLIGKTDMAQSNGTLREFVVLKDRSYQCKSPSSVKVNDRVTISYTGLRAQAFLAQDYFSTPEPCAADAQSSDLIPIIIGAVLAAIVLIVLIVYLIGRARMRRSTYESI